MIFRRVFALSVFLMSLCAAAQTSRPEPTDKEVSLTVISENADHSRRAGDRISFEGERSKKVYMGVTADSGRFYLLLPKGDTYTVRYRNFQDSVQYSRFELPNEKGRIYYEYTLTIGPTKTYTLRDVHFDTGKATLRPESFPALNDLAEVLKYKKQMVVEIAGHTDDVGEAAANQKLSQDRAEAVKKYLVSKGIAEARIRARGYGEAEPVAPNDTEEGRSRNRRTEVRILHE
jgi:OOP family OmpA-OmpF porin